MAGEWKRATWTFDSSLGHTNANIMSAIDTFLTSVGWGRAAWDTSTIRQYLRTDRFSLGLTNDAVGTAGNVSITKTSALGTVTGMSGGTSSVAATGTIAFAGNPADGDIFTISDGTTSVTFEIEAGAGAASGVIAFLNAAQPADGDQVIINDGVNAAVTFEFDSNSSVTQTGTLRQVVIGANIAATIANLVSAINNPTPTLAVTAISGANSTVTLTNDAAGSSGNQALTKTAGANIALTGMTGGGVAGVTGGNIPVSRGAAIEDTIVNLVAAINANAFNVTAKWNNRWTYNGDGPWQHCGLQITNDTANSRIVIQTMLENTTKSGLQRAQNVAHQINIAYQTTAPNNFLFIGGEWGFFGECGRDGLNVNLAHWAVATFDTAASLFGTDDARLHWTTQGIGMDLFGVLKFSDSSQNRFVDSAGSSKNYTASLHPYMVRSAVSFATSVPVDDQRMYIGNRDLYLSPAFTNSGSSISSAVHLGRSTFGVLFSPRDGRYRISPMITEQISNAATLQGCYVASSSVSNNVAQDAQGLVVIDYRHLRDIPKFVCIDSSLVPFVSLTDQATGITYRVSQIADGGRATNIGIELPDSGNVVSIPTAGA